MAEQAPSLGDGSSLRRLRPETSAWLILATFFGVFCALVALLGYLGWMYYATAMQPVGNARLHAHVPIGVLYFQPNATSGTPPDKVCGNGDSCADIKHEGERITAAPEAGYGQVAVLELPDATGALTMPLLKADIWSHPTGAELTLERYRMSRWYGNRLEVRMQQTSGYVRYDAAPLASQIQARYTVVITDGVQVQFMPNGSYSILVPRTLGGVFVPQLPNEDPFLLEVAVRQHGAASVLVNGIRRDVLPGQKLRIRLDRVFGDVEAARWNLLADGDFASYTTSEYNDPAQTTKTWSVIPGAFENPEEDGRFLVVRTCTPARADYCPTEQDQITAGRFRAGDSQQTPSITAIEQRLDTDISEYRSIKLKASIRIINQGSLVSGSSSPGCPLTIQLTYKQVSPNDQQVERFFCLYLEDGESVGGARQSATVYRGVPRYSWVPIEYELRDDQRLKSARYLQRIRVYAGGTGYYSEITNLSLTGLQTVDLLPAATVHQAEASVPRTSTLHGEIR